MSGLPEDRWEHTCDRVDLEALCGRRCLILGGRQSAFEWATLLLEAGSAAVDVAFRHDLPNFELSHWSWVDPMMERTVAEPGWFRRLHTKEREALEQRFWYEGRQRLEPWLAPRLSDDRLRTWPRMRPIGWGAEGDTVVAELDSGATIRTDHVILATGYRVDMRRVPYLRHASINSWLQLDQGFPVLDDAMQSTVPGLYLPGLPATRSFGPFIGFVRGCPPAAQIIVASILENLPSQG